MIKLFRKNPEILASQVVIKPHTPWYSRLFIVVIFIALLLVLSWGMYKAGSQSAKFDQALEQKTLEHLYDLDTCSKNKKQALCTQIAGLIRQSQINNTTHQDIVKEVKSLGDENNRMKEELAFFQRLMSGNGEISSGVSIYHFNLRKETLPGKYRYALSLVQGGQRPKDFQGSLKFSVNLVQNGQKKIIPLTHKDISKEFSINFKFYHRIEENFQVPLDTIVESLQVQVFKHDATEAILTQTVKLST